MNTLTEFSNTIVKLNADYSWLLPVVCGLAIYVIFQMLRWQDNRSRRLISPPMSTTAGEMTTAQELKTSSPPAATHAVRANDEHQLTQTEPNDFAELREFWQGRHRRLTERMEAVELGNIEMHLELAKVRESTTDLRTQLEQAQHELLDLNARILNMQSAQRVSAPYQEAVSLAQKGLNADQIAENCGISVAEADLVRALIDENRAD